MNYCYREFFENKMAAVQFDIIQQRNRLREQCDLENKSMFTAIMETIKKKKEDANPSKAPEVESVNVSK